MRISSDGKSILMIGFEGGAELPFCLMEWSIGKPWAIVRRAKSKEELDTDEALHDSSEKSPQ